MEDSVQSISKELNSSESDDFSKTNTQVD